MWRLNSENSIRLNSFLCAWHAHFLLSSPRHLLETGQFYKFFTYVELSTFDVSSDAFATFKELLTRHENLLKVN